jgi:putative addiction module component (TIGR02574 family)
MPMPITPDEIVEEASHWPPEQRAELVDRLTFTLHHAVDPKIDDAWKQETRRRLAEIESGRVQAVPGQEVSAKIRRIVGR